MPNPSKWYVTSIFWTFMADISLFFAISTCLDALGRSRDRREHRGGGLACLAFQNGMLLRFFGHLLLIFRCFS